MVQQIRIEYEGATYHVMARGNQGQTIYEDEQDCKVCQEALGQVCEKLGGGNEMVSRD